jgi:hypothetical protein
MEWSPKIGIMLNQNKNLKWGHTVDEVRTRIWGLSREITIPDLRAGVG